MTKVPINEMLADNLRFYMDRSELLRTQEALAQRAGVSQRTISNYLNPKKRQAGSKGKDPSAKLSELALIADALQIEVWHLLRPSTSIENDLLDDFRQLMEKTIARARDADAAVPAQEPRREYRVIQAPKTPRRKPPRAA